jgi:predicted transcriptional regulator of viral defense system
MVMEINDYMETKHTILSKKDATLLEDAIVGYGRIVTFDQLSRVFTKQYSRARAKNRISLLSKIGWLARLRKGLYVIVTDIGSLAAGDISTYTMCQALNHDSYISFENALQHHGMFDQMLSTVGAVTHKRARKYSIKGTEIKFFNIKKGLYFGFAQEKSDIGLVNIAEKEKAILDILYFRSNDYYVSLVWEKLKEHKDDIDFDLLKKHARKFNMTIVRQVGFLLDRLGINTEDLESIVKGNTGYGRMTKKSRDFNSKWRLYFDHTIIE